MADADGGVAGGVRNLDTYGRAELGESEVSGSEDDMTTYLNRSAISSLTTGRATKGTPKAAECSSTCTLKFLAASSGSNPVEDETLPTLSFI